MYNECYSLTSRHKITLRQDDMLFKSINLLRPKYCFLQAIVYFQVTIPIQLQQSFVNNYSLKVWFGLIGLYGISTIVGYLMPTHFIHIH